MNVRGAAQRGRWTRQRVALAPGVVVIVVALAVLGGWMADVDALKSLSPRFSQMKANTALLFICSGLSLLLLQAGRRRASHVLAGFVLLVAVVTLVEHLFGWRLGIDELVFHDDSVGPGTPAPGRMGAMTAFDFLLAGLSLLLIDVVWRRVRVSELGALAIGAVASVALLGYILGLPRSDTAFVTRLVTPMAVHTAMLFLVLAAGLVTVRPDVGVVALMRSQGAGGILVRRLLLPAAIMPLLLGYVRLEGQRAGLYGTELGVALFATSLSVGLTLLVVLTARTLERIDVARRASDAWARGTAEGALDGIVTMDSSGAILDLNPAAERKFGYARAEAVGREMAELLLPPSARDLHRQGLARYLSTGVTTILGRRIEVNAMRKDGSEFEVELAIMRLDGPGEPIFVGHVRDISGRVAAQRTTTRLAAIVDSSTDAIIATDLDGRVTSWNLGAERLYGYSAAEMLGRETSHLIPAAHEEETRDVLQRAAHGESIEFETVTVRKSGETLAVSQTVFPIIGSGDEVVGVAAIAKDMTDRNRLEAQLRQSQKMEAVGQLAGGVAHDFNNLLTVIGGYAALARERIGVGPGAEQLVEIEHAADRAGALTHQLLAFSRHQVLRPAPLDLNEVVGSLMPMLGRLIGENIRVGVLADDDLPVVVADRGQIEQVIINLAVNARDAMPDGGTLTVETRAVELDDEDARGQPVVAVGKYARLTVSDNGVGIPAELQPHIFEPFFTTKEVGEGTGLGLSTVDGIVAQSGGHLRVHSELGLGTSFNVYLPASTQTVASQAPVDSPVDELRGDETILVCEDEDMVSRYMQAVLTQRGYSVLVAAHPTEALEIARNAGQTIDILVTDVVMPDMDGPTLAGHLAELRPGLPVVFVSGYAAEHLQTRGLPHDHTFLQKPFRADKLLQAIRQLLAVRR